MTAEHLRQVSARESITRLFEREVGANVEGGIVKNSGHWIMEEQPDQTVALVRTFLDRK